MFKKGDKIIWGRGLVYEGTGVVVRVVGINFWIHWDDECEPREHPYNWYYDFGPEAFDYLHKRFRAKYEYVTVGIP